MLQKSIYKFYKCLNARLAQKTDFQNSCAAVWLTWCRKQVKDLILKFWISGSFFSEKKTFWLLGFNTGFFPFRWISRCDCWYSSKLSRLQMWCSFPWVSYISSYIFQEAWRSLLDYHKYFWYIQVNPFLANIPIRYALKTPKKWRFSDACKGYQMGTLVRKGLKHI